MPQKIDKSQQVRKLPAPRADTFTALMNIRVTPGMFDELGMTEGQALAAMGEAVKTSYLVAAGSIRSAGVEYRNINGDCYAVCEVMEGGWFDSEYTGHTYVTTNALDDLRHKVMSQRRDAKLTHAIPTERIAAMWGDAGRILSITVFLFTVTTRATQVALVAAIGFIKSLRIRISALIAKPLPAYPTTDRRVRVWQGSHFEPRY